MQVSYPIPNLLDDRGGRRLGMDRRKAHILEYDPERHSWKDRRSNQDRRSRNDQGNISYLRRNMDRYVEFANANKGIIFGLLLSFPFWALMISIVILKFCF